MPDIELVPGRILVAEDSPTTQILIRSVLRGWVVDIASDGAEALHLFQNRDYDLILMDIEMPDMDGRQAAQAIRSFEKEFARVADGIGDPTLLKSIPILAMSAHSGDLIEDPAMDRFFDDFIPKPINKREMLAKVNKWTARCQAQAEDCRKEHAKTETIVENTPIDLQRAIREFDGDKDLVLSVLTAFLSTVKEQIARVRSAHLKQDIATIEKTAHSIKGGASNIAAFPLARAASILEQSCAIAVGESRARLIEDLAREFYNLENHGRAYKQQSL